MRAYADKFGGDAEEWGITGLLHDFDYELHPTAEEHPYFGNAILEERGYPEHIRKAVMSHAAYTGVPRETMMEKCLFAVDELCGFLTACALVRPDKSLQALEVKSVRKKLKDKAFARGVNREDILQGAQELGVDLDAHIAFVIEALRPVEGEIGLGLTGSR